MFKHLNRGISAPIAITIIVISAVIFVGGVFAYQYFSKPQFPITDVQSNSKIQNLNVETAGWKTYTSNELKYSFKYPSNWKVIPNSAYSAAGFGGLVGYTITTSNSKIPPDNERIDIGGAQVDCASLSNLNRQEHPAGVLCKTVYPIYTFSTDPQVISVFNLMADSISEIKTTTGQTAGLKTYNSNLYGFMFEYPNVLTLKSTDNEFSLYHSVPFKHSDPCNLKDGASIDVITDFNITGTIENGNINDVLRSANYYGINFDSNGKPVIDENSGVKEFKNVNLIGYIYSMGNEGCGVDVYYFSLKNNKTLVLRDLWVGEFSPANGYTGQYDKLAGVILPDKHSVYLNQILSTFKFTK